MEAVQTLTGEVGHWIPPLPAPKKDEPKELLLPKKNRSCDRVIQYLFGRGIDYQLIQDCVADGTIFESAEYHNAVFVGRDESGTPKYAACRSTLGSSFKGDASGSDKINWIQEKSLWKGIKSIGMVRKTIVKDSKETIEKRYYINSLPLNINVFTI